MKYFQMVENNSSYLYVYHAHFKYTTSMCKKHQLMNDQFLYDFHYQIVGWEVITNNQKFLGYMSIAVDTMTHHVREVLFE
jgi:hypothetical protein